MSGIEVVLVVTLGTVALLITFIRGPRPDPRLAAQPLSVTARDIAIVFVYSVGTSLLLSGLPHEVRLPASITIMATTLAVGVWWYRRHASRAEAAISTEAASVPAPADEPVGTTADWVKAMVLIVAIIGAVVVLFMAGIGAFCGCTTQPGM